MNSIELSVQLSLCSELHQQISKAAEQTGRSIFEELQHCIELGLAMHVAQQNMNSPESMFEPSARVSIMPMILTKQEPSPTPSPQPTILPPTVEQDLADAKRSVPELPKMMEVFSILEHLHRVKEDADKPEIDPEIEAIINSYDRGEEPLPQQASSSR